MGNGEWGIRIYKATNGSGFRQTRGSADWERRLAAYSLLPISYSLLSEPNVSRFFPALGLDFERFWRESVFLLLKFLS